jgi:hypothetical protein
VVVEDEDTRRLKSVVADHCTAECVGLHAAKLRHALRGVGAGAPGGPGPLRRDGRPAWRAGSRCATTTVAST